MTKKMPSLADKIKSATLEKPPHLIVIARAGCGKTTTWIEGLNYLKGKKPKIIPSPQQKAIWDEMALSRDARTICLCSFSNTIVDELKERVPSGCEARTVSSLGYSSVRGFYDLLPGDDAINENRVPLIMEKIAHMDIRTLRERYPEQVSTTIALVKLCKMNLFDGTREDDLDYLVDSFELETADSRDKIYAMVPKILTACKNVARDRYIDYDDMLWIPVVNNLSVRTFDFLIVDELQDLSRCQHALIRKMGRRIGGCGDDRQAIYQFAGADARSMTRIENQLRETENSCNVLKLTVTRRCGKAIVAEAKKLVPDFEAHESNCEGKISYMSLRADKSLGLSGRDYRTQVRDGDMVLCRANAPLVSEVFKFIRQGRKANIRGRDIGQRLVNLVERLDKRKSHKELTGIGAFIAKLEDWSNLEIQKETSRKFPSENKIEGITDRRMCIEAFCEEAESVADVIQKIEEIFTDQKTKGILLSSIHKAKGLESDRVFWIRIPRRVNLPPQQVEAEDNLDYVATTRAISELIYVSSPEKKRVKR